MDKITVIDQSGEHKCLVCGNKFNWSYKLNRLVGIIFSVPYNGEVTEPISDPPGHVNFVTKGNDEVEFSIACPKCHYVHITERMKLLK